MGALAALSVTPGITDKSPDEASLLSSCFRTEIDSLQSPVSLVPIPGIPPSPAMKTGISQQLPWPQGQAKAAP